MPRVVSLYLPTWSTDRASKTGQIASPPASPLVTATRQGSKRTLSAIDEAAGALGLRPGMTVAHAQALVPDLAIAEARPGADEQALTELALWCLRYAPVVAPDPPGGVLIDIAGAAHLHAGGEAALLADLVER